MKRIRERDMPPPAKATVLGLRSGIVTGTIVQVSPALAVDAKSNSGSPNLFPLAAKTQPFSVLKRKPQQSSKESAC